jgi:hypothetical protein
LPLIDGLEFFKPRFINIVVVIVVISIGHYERKGIMGEEE